MRFFEMFLIALVILLGLARGGGGVGQFLIRRLLLRQILVDLHLCKLVRVPTACTVLASIAGI